MSELEPIIKYGMNDKEAKAFKVAVIWQEECRNEIPNEPFAKLKTNSDPRKSTLFKYCYKLVSEMKGILDDKDLRLYVRAQIQILKSIREGSVHALVEPHCLVGEKAWKRWKVWHRMYKKKLNRSLTSEQVGLSTKESKVIVELKKTKEFLISRGCDERFKLLENMRNMERWTKNGEVSYFYILLSPWMKGYLNNFSFDQTYYRSSITPKVEEFFNEEFSHEKKEEK